MSTFDLATCLIKDMNLFKEDAMQCARYLNLRCEPTRYEVVEIKDGKPRACSDVTFNLGVEAFVIHRQEYFQGTPEKDWDDAEDHVVTVNTKTADIKKTGLDQVTIVTPEKYRFHLTRKPTYYSVF